MADFFINAFQDEFLVQGKLFVSLFVSHFFFRRYPGPTSLFLVINHPSQQRMILSLLQTSSSCSSSFLFQCDQRPNKEETTPVPEADSRRPLCRKGDGNGAVEATDRLPELGSSCNIHTMSWSAYNLSGVHTLAYFVMLTQMQSKSHWMRCRARGFGGGFEQLLGYRSYRLGTDRGRRGLSVYPSSCKL